MMRNFIFVLINSEVSYFIDIFTHSMLNWEPIRKYSEFGESIVIMKYKISHLLLDWSFWRYEKVYVVRLK